MSVLEASQVESFFEDGYVVLRGVFTAPEVRRMRVAFDRLARMATRLGSSGMYRGSQFVLRQAGAGVRIERIVWCGAAEPVLSDLGRDPRLLRVAGQLLGTGRLSQLINQAHFKLPGDGVEFPWHQDSVHRRYGRGQWVDVNGRGSYVQTVIAVDDVTLDNGPLEMIPGSCGLGHLEPPDGTDGWLPPGLLERRGSVSATMTAGSVLLFGPYTFHRSRPNRSVRPRRVFINGYACPGANLRVYPGEGAGRLLEVPGSA